MIVVQCGGNQEALHNKQRAKGVHFIAHPLARGESASPQTHECKALHHLLSPSPSLSLSSLVRLVRKTSQASRAPALNLPVCSPACVLPADIFLALWRVGIRDHGGRHAPMWHMASTTHFSFLFFCLCLTYCSAVCAHAQPCATLLGPGRAYKYTRQHVAMQTTA